MCVCVWWACSPGQMGLSCAGLWLSGVSPGSRALPLAVLLRDWKYSHPGADQALRGRRDARRTAGVPATSVPMHECQRGTRAAGAKPTHTNTHMHKSTQGNTSLLASVLIVITTNPAYFKDPEYHRDLTVDSFHLRQEETP